MSVKNVGLWALALTLCGVGAACAQGPATPVYGPVDPAAPPAQPGQVFSMNAPAPPGPPASDPVPPASLSSWILYNQPCCCGPFGHHQPLRYELYLRAGPSFPIEGAIFGRTLETGWAIEGGARMVLFNVPQTAAWTVDIGLTNIHNNGRRPEIKVPIILNDTVTGPNGQTITLREPIPVSIHALNRTFVNLSGGREWYLLGDGSCHGPAWRVGADVGGSWGTGKVEFNEIRHRTDVLGRVFVAVHSDLEIPRGCCIFLFGLRGVWGYTWSDILQRRSSGDVQDIMVLGNLGVRF
ncbi:MAG TPA: hypothetical protein VNK04_16155 [Gemmataceae bacterium]|nr:hypothetical protein [Gemmataceae bacterium]